MEKLQLLESVLNKGEKTNRDYYQFHCPFCQHYKKKLGISLGTGKWKCWVCNTNGSNVSILFKKLKQPEVKIQQSKNLWKIKEKFQRKEIPNFNLPKEFVPLWQPSGSVFFNKAKNYLLSRGLTEGDLIKNRIGFCETGIYQDMIIFPSYDQDLNLNFFSGRTFNNLSEYKFKIPNEINKDEILFDENLVNWQEPVILVESKLDAIIVKRNALPLYGKQINKKLKVKILEETPPEIIFCLDGDALKDAIENSIYFIQNGIKCSKVKLPINEDPNSLGFEKIWQFINQREEIRENDIFKFKMFNKLK